MSSLLATYIHNLDPIIFKITDSGLALRWYGLAYVLGFVLGYLCLLWLSKRKIYPIAADKLGDFITYIAIFGVILGGRFGEFFFYWLPKYGWEGFCNDPLWVFRVWEGGMASHGGIIGVALVALIYSYRHKLSFLSVADGLAIVAPIGIFFGRVANFINGELYGRACDAGHWLAMKFPAEINELSYGSWLAMKQATGLMAQSPSVGDYNSLVIAAARVSPDVQAKLAPFLTPRYPSQLFEALGEGLIIFVVLFTLRLCWKKAPAGIFCALFCFLYALGRIVAEAFKEPQEPLWQGITRGQYLSFGLVALGFVILAFVLKNRKRAAQG